MLFELCSSYGVGLCVVWFGVMWFVLCSSWFCSCVAISLATSMLCFCLGCVHSMLWVVLLCGWFRCVVFCGFVYLFLLTPDIC